MATRAASSLPIRSLTGAAGCPRWARETGFAPSSRGILHRRGAAQRRISGAAMTTCSMDVSLLGDHVQQIASLASHLTLAYEKVALPCSVQNCGDAVYRSTLDASLRGEDGITLSPLGASFILAALTYLVVPTPGVLQGWYDTFIKAAVQKKSQRKLSTDDFNLTKQIGKGAFGTVWLGGFKDPLPEDYDEDGNLIPVVVKKATEYGLAEAYMNDRVSRCAPETCAGYIGALDGEKGTNEQVWLVFKYEGDSTLGDLVMQKDFTAAAGKLLGVRNPTKKTPEKRAQVIRVVMRQLFSQLAKLHGEGLVHRDIKPQNIIVTREGEIKFIDLGAMADLRVGRNYAPKEFVLDPRFAAPEQFIMQTSTVVPGADWLAALLSPLVWNLERPDKFDMYSLGIMVMQFAFPALRTDKGLIQFNRDLKSCGYSLERWRNTQVRAGRDIQEGFAVLDKNNGAGWDLVKKMVREQPSERISAADALKHPFVTGKSLSEGGISKLARAANEKADAFLADDDIGEWLFDSMARSGTEKVGGLTEAQLDDMNDMDKDFRKQMGGRMAPTRERQGTIAWWQDRQGKKPTKRQRPRKPEPESELEPAPPPPKKKSAFKLPFLSVGKEMIGKKK